MLHLLNMQLNWRIFYKTVSKKYASLSDKMTAAVVTQNEFN